MITINFVFLEDPNEREIDVNELPGIRLLVALRKKRVRGLEAVCLSQDLIHDQVRVVAQLLQRGY